MCNSIMTYEQPASKFVHAIASPTQGFYPFLEYHSHFYILKLFPNCMSSVEQSTSSFAMESLEFIGGAKRQIPSEYHGRYIRSKIRSLRVGFILLHLFA